MEVMQLLVLEEVLVEALRQYCTAAEQEEGTSQELRQAKRAVRRKWNDICKEGYMTELHQGEYTRIGPIAGNTTRDTGYNITSRIDRSYTDMAPWQLNGVDYQTAVDLPVNIGKIRHGSDHRRGHQCTSRRPADRRVECQRRRTRLSARHGARRFADHHHLGDASEGQRDQDDPTRLPQGQVVHGRTDR